MHLPPPPPTSAGGDQGGGGGGGAAPAPAPAAAAAADPDPALAAEPAEGAGEPGAGAEGPAGPEEGEEAAAAAPAEGADAGGGGPAAAAPAAGEDVGEDRLELLGAQLASQAQELEAAERSKQELEDMLIRIEKHFKAEQSLRRKAETTLAESRASAQSVDEIRAGFKAEQMQLEQERAQLHREKEQLENEKIAMEEMLSNARLDTKRAQAALRHADENAKAVEDMVRLRLEAEYNSKISRLVVELERMRQELDTRTQIMSKEMRSWKQQAEFATTALRDAKNEVLERKKELDTTKEKMDSMVEKLYMGRERGLELKGAIDFQMQEFQRQRLQDQQREPYEVMAGLSPTSRAQIDHPVQPSAQKAQRTPGARSSASKLPQIAKSEAKSARVKTKPVEYGRRPVERKPSFREPKPTPTARETPRPGYPDAGGGYAKLYQEERTEAAAAAGPKAGQGPPKRKPGGAAGPKGRAKAGAPDGERVRKPSALKKPPAKAGRERAPKGRAEVARYGRGGPGQQMAGYAARFD